MSPVFTGSSVGRVSKNRESHMGQDSFLQVLPNQWQLSLRGCDVMRYGQCGRAMAPATSLGHPRRLGRHQLSASSRNHSGPP